MEVLRLYGEDGKDVWRDVEPDEELQHELRQLVAKRDELALRLEAYNKMIARKEQEIIAENQRRLL